MYLTTINAIRYGLKGIAQSHEVDDAGVVDGSIWRRSVRQQGEWRPPRQSKPVKPLNRNCQLGTMGLKCLKYLDVVDKVHGLEQGDETRATTSLQRYRRQIR